MGFSVSATAGGGDIPVEDFVELLAAALQRRARLLAPNSPTDAARVFSGAADGVDGIFIDRYGIGATLIIYEGRAPRGFDPARFAPHILKALSPLGVTSLYLKPFARDRSKLGGELPPEATSPTPLAGTPLPEAHLMREHSYQLEIRLFDGLSTGIFLDQRENRAWVAQGVKARMAGGGTAPSILNTFAYTCAFSVAAAAAGAHTTSVDVSPRYLEWGKRNFAHNGLDTSMESSIHRFARMDTFEFLEYAKRKGLGYDLVILDPPSFSAGSKKKGIRPWSSISDYPDLLRAARAVCNPRGSILASTNTVELCRPGRLEQMVSKALGAEPRWLELPPAPVDFARDKDRFSAVAFTPR